MASERGARSAERLRTFIPSSLPLSWLASTGVSVSVSVSLCRTFDHCSDHDVLGLDGQVDGGVGSPPRLTASIPASSAPISSSYLAGGCKCSRGWCRQYHFIVHAPGPAYLILQSRQHRHVLCWVRCSSFLRSAPGAPTPDGSVARGTGRWCVLLSTESCVLDTDLWTGVSVLSPDRTQYVAHRLGQ